MQGPLPSSPHDTSLRVMLQHKSRWRLHCRAFIRLPTPVAWLGVYVIDGMQLYLEAALRSCMITAYAAN
jgi:formate-dependent phosphoribosylglycinamide formyltransferase (GAR transformylase)